MVDSLGLFIVYRVLDAQASADAIRRLDSFPRPKAIVGAGMAAKGHLGEEERFYVFVNLDPPTRQNEEQVRLLLSEFGSPTEDTYETLTSDPVPHLLTSGTTEQILASMRGYFPGRFR